MFNLLLGNYVAIIGFSTIIYLAYKNVYVEYFTSKQTENDVDLMKSYVELTNIRNKYKKKLKLLEYLRKKK